MKKLFTLFAGLLLALLWSCGSLQAQTTTDEHDHQASWFVGGVASFWIDSDAGKTSLEFQPEFGYFLNDTWAVGLIAGYGLESHEVTGEKVLQHEVSLSPFVRYYYLHRGPFNLYVDGNVGYSYETSKGNSHHGYEVGLRPGACVDLAEGLCLCMRLGFLGYRKSFHGEEPSVPSNGFGLSFTPEHLMIGLELEF